LINRSKILTILREYKAQKSAELGILEMGIFGSCARNEHIQYSDIDVVVRMQKQDLFDLIGIKQDLEESLLAQVDIVSYRSKMNQFLKERIDREAVYV